MSTVTDSAVPTLPRSRPRHYGRWGLIVVASLLIHLGALDVLPHGSIEPADDATEEPIRARLLPPLAPAPTPPPVDAPSQPRAVPRKAAAPAFVPESFDPIPRIAVAPLPATTGAVAASGPADATPTVAAEAPVPAPPSPAPATSPTPTPSPSPAPAPAATVPQSARLSYTVVATDLKNYNTITYHGIGSIDWTIADGRYRSDIVAAVDLLIVKLNVLASHSEGTITPQGLAPDRYTESPRKRATVATSFNRDARQSITFSASQASVPLMTGAQDRLSVLFQIGALLLANGQPPVGGRIDIPVAGVRGDVDTWSFEVMGEESIAIATGPLVTTHLRRTPRAGTNDRTIDVWVAVQNGGYPGRVLYTEPNGSTIDMTLEKIGAVS